MPGVLEGVRVLDFGRYIAGPCAPPCSATSGGGHPGGEGRRRRGPFHQPGQRRGRQRRHLSSGQPQQEMPDPRSDHGRRAGGPAPARGHRRRRGRQHAAAALEQLGLDYASLAEIRPDVILVSNTCFGAAGPYGRKLGFDGLAQAMCGNMHLSGHPDEPIRSYAPWVDFSTAALCALGAVIALLARRQTGRGQEVQGALLATALTAASPALIEQAVLAPDGKPPATGGSSTRPRTSSRPATATSWSW